MQLLIAITRIRKVAFPGSVGCGTPPGNVPLRDSGIREGDTTFISRDVKPMDFPQRSACTPALFLNPLSREYPERLDPACQRDRLERLRIDFGPDLVKVGQPGFESLTRPHRIGVTC